jgi:hypothetical protein
MNQEDHAYEVLLRPTALEEDIKQEAELLKLRGKTPSLRILRKKFNRFEALLAGMDEDLKGAEPPPWDLAPMPPQEVIDQLIDWAMNQSEVISMIIFDFLEEPSDESLTTTISILKENGVDLFTKKVVRKSLTTIIIEAINQEPRDIYDLYELARKELQSERPEAAVRQILRRLQRAGQVIRTGNIISRGSK